MCCCGKPTVNGELGYRWNDPNAEPRVRPVNAPELMEGDTLLFDEPGRCGGLDCHSHHYRVIKGYAGGYWLLVRHGGGDERIRMSNGSAVNAALSLLDSNGRYWILSAMFYAQSDSARVAREKESSRWSTAAAQKRIKVRKIRGQDRVKVSIQAV